MVTFKELSVFMQFALRSKFLRLHVDFAGMLGRKFGLLTRAEVR